MAPARRVPEREIEHAVQAPHKRVTFGVVHVQQHFVVRAGLEAVALGLQLGAQLAVVVDLAVARRPERLLDIAQRLVAAGQVDDRQAAHRDAAIGVNVHALVIGPAMPRDVAHRRQGVGHNALAVEIENPVDAAHAR